MDNYQKALIFFNEVIKMKGTLGENHPEILKAELKARHIREEIDLMAKHDAENIQLDLKLKGDL